MKKVFFVLAAAVVLFACNQQPEAPEVLMAKFGAEFNPEGAISIEEVAKILAEKDSVELTFRANIVQTCAKMGCWMDVKMPDGSDMTVFMRDHAFFVPVSGMEGKPAIINGYAYRTEHSVEFLRHLAEDAGKSEEEIMAITEPQAALAFNAAGVIIEGIAQPEESAEGHDHHDHDHEGEGEHSH